MYTSKDNSSPEKSRAIANTLAHKSGGPKSANAQVKRETSAMQSEIQKMADNSSQVRKLQQYQAMTNNANQLIQPKRDLEALKEEEKKAQKSYDEENNKTRKEKLKKATKSVTAKEDEIKQEESKLIDFKVGGPVTDEQQERGEKNVSGFMAAAAQSSSGPKQQPHGGEASQREQLAVRAGNDRYGSGDEGHKHFSQVSKAAAVERSAEGIRRQQITRAIEENGLTRLKIAQLKNKS